jgi:glycosyltransferase involved in cell wall biosynthesis
MRAPILLMARELNLGGSERQMTETARFLDRTRFDPRVGCFLPAGLRGEELKQAGVPIVQFPVHSYKSWSAVQGAWALAAYIQRENIQLVHAFVYPLNVFAIPVARWFTSAVAVASQRSGRELIPPGYLPLVRASDRLAHAIVVNCAYLERHLVEDERVPAERIEVCYNGIDLDRFRPSASTFRPPALAGASLVIGVVCGLRPEKGLPLLLDAFSRVRSGSMKLAIVGSGSLLPELETRARELGIFNQCVFQPATSDVPDWLRAIDIFVLPSLSEALSNSLMEAMACGCCVIASDVGGNPELVRPGETGLLFERGNPESLAAALVRVIDNTDLRRRLASGGERFIRANFSAASAARRMGEIYTELLTRHSKMPLHNTQEPQTANRR